MRLAGYSPAVEPLRRIVEQLEIFSDRHCTPEEVAEAVSDVFAKLDVIKTELYGVFG